MFVFQKQIEDDSLKLDRTQQPEQPESVEVIRKKRDREMDTVERDEKDELKELEETNFLQEEMNPFKNDEKPVRASTPSNAFAKVIPEGPRKLFTKKGKHTTESRKMASSRKKKTKKAKTRHGSSKKSLKNRRMKTKKVNIHLCYG